jgi:hypothetical protein
MFSAMELKFIPLAKEILIQTPNKLTKAKCTCPYSINKINSVRFPVDKANMAKIHP